MTNPERRLREIGAAMKQMKIHEARLVPKIGAARWAEVKHAAGLSMSNWLEPLVLQAQGLGPRPALRLHRGTWVRYLGEPGELQQHVPTGTYGQVCCPIRPYVLFENLDRLLIAPPRLLEIVPAPPRGHRRWHLRQRERRWKAIERARAVWGEDYEPGQLSRTSA